VGIHWSARRHGVTDEDIEHAMDHSIAWLELGDESQRYPLAGLDGAGNLFELVVVILGRDELVFTQSDFGVPALRDSSETSDDRPTHLWAHRAQ
jgi:hypothetical protein